MQRYNLYEFYGDRLIGLDAPIDFSTRIKKSLAGVIKSVESHNDNALFYQTWKCIQDIANGEEKNDFSEVIATWNDNTLKNYLIYIDFSKVFPLEKHAPVQDEEKDKKLIQKEQEQYTTFCRDVESLFEHGFSIKHSETDIVHYVPFEKSASMSRQCHMLFVDDRLYEDLESRLRLGFDYSKAPVSASKLYAYTGLYLSDARRINESEKFMLNEETVIVLRDNVYHKNDKHEHPIIFHAISGFDPHKRDGLQEWDIRDEEKYETDITFFDGEGLVSKKYCALINEALNVDYGMRGIAASIQIRMPFIKGMLHDVDFHAFICEKLGVDSCEDLYIEDAYGHKRNLAKAQIILTQSMFKIDKWLNEEAISSLKKGEDPLKHYFDRFHQYDHAFYVGITDMKLSQVGKTKLNYQFLNTLALTEEELSELADEQVSLALSDKAIDFVREANTPCFDEGIAFDQIIDDAESWCAVASRNSAFWKDPKVKGMMKGVRYSLLKDVGLGRLTVSGSTKFLSRDLLAFLGYMLGRVEPNDVINQNQIETACIQIKQNRLRSYRFFVADCVPSNPFFSNAGKKLRLCSKKYYGLLRNPHLSRNEQCSLRPFIPSEDDDYSKYFRHLKGIIMVPMNSFVPQALGGADFDGDLIKVITDKRINRAINDACYYPDQKGSSRKHERKLPIVMIPDTIPNKKELPENIVDYQTLLDTFSSKVGNLSNCAIGLGKREYDEKNPDPNYDLQCEACTILVGLEIDAAKTGQHPFVGNLLTDGIDYFVQKKDEIEALPEQYKYTVEEFKESEKTNGTILPHRLAAIAKYGSDTGREYMSAVFTDDYNGFYSLDKLPFRFLQELKDYKEPVIADDDSKVFRFSFEKDKAWKKHLVEQNKEALVKELIISYKQIQNTSRSVYRIEERLKKSNYIGCIRTILNIQYAGLMEDQQITELQEQIYWELIDHLDSYDKAEAALNKLVEEYSWQYNRGNKTEDMFAYASVIDTSAPVSAEVIDALTNFRWNGYFLLYYYIKDIMLYYREGAIDNRIDQGEEYISSQTPGKYYHEFRSIYEEALSNKESKKIWEHRIIERCRHILKEAFDNRVDLALLHTHALRSCDQYGTFFWDVFTANEILENSEGFNNAK